ncbi:MAG: hypothetical protein IJU77_11565 [Butyrivibrio sp.]|nr:hypothetical protein [Butyrivibrio sp.]
MSDLESAGDIIDKAKVGTLMALSDAIVLQQNIIDQLYLTISSIDVDLIDEHTLAQMKRAAQITDDYA